MSTKKTSPALKPDTKKNTKGSASFLDVFVGNMIRKRRIELGLSQETLADSLGVTFQQVQKYERGINRITLGRFYQIIKVFKDDVTPYFRKIDKLLGYKSSYQGLSDNEQEPFGLENIVRDEELADLLRAYYAIENPEERRKAIAHIKQMASKAGSAR